MADLALVQRTDSLKYDFQVAGGDLVRTNDPWPAIFRLLLQGSWIGDDGERSGDSLSDVALITTRTRDQVTRIVLSRLSTLLKTGQITAVEVVDVLAVDGKVVAQIRVTVPGEQPRVIQVPLTR